MPFPRFRVGSTTSLPVFEVVACVSCGAPIIERNFLIDYDTGERDGPFCNGCVKLEIEDTAH